MFREFHYQARGRAHLEEGTPVQDRTRYLSRSGVQVLCLADGAGSAQHSDLGAQITVDSGCAVLAERFEAFSGTNDGAAVKQELLARLNARIDAVASRRGISPSDLACTFLAVAMSDETFIGAHVGDGVIGFLKDGELRAISLPDNEEFANRTTFVTSAGAASSMRLFRGSLAGVDGFVLMSDGAAETLFNPRSNELARACKKLMSAVGSPAYSQAKRSSIRKRLGRFIDLSVRLATKDDCSVAVFGRTRPESRGTDAASGSRP
ncbi:protein phosphatase 2C domain-containing protein [Microbacterium maritypicum]